MKKNKGFTLIEVIATIIILSILALVITPIITGLIKDTRTSIAKEQKEIIIRSAKKWATANVDILPLEDNAYCIMTLEQLKKSGYYEDKEIIANPEGGEFDGFIYFRYKASSYDYDITYEEEYKTGDNASKHCF